MCATFKSAFSPIFWWLLVCCLQSERWSGADSTYPQTFKNICKTLNEKLNLSHFVYQKKEQEQNRWSRSISAAYLHFCFGESPKSTQFPRIHLLMRFIFKVSLPKSFLWQCLGILLVHFFPFFWWLYCPDTLLPLLMLTIHCVVFMYAVTTETLPVSSFILKCYSQDISKQKVTKLIIFFFILFSIFAEKKYVIWCYVLENQEIQRQIVFSLIQCLEFMGCWLM